jgi:hypothetical protein
LEGLATENLGILYDYLVYFTAIGNILMVIWYILWPFSIVFTVLVFCTKKNLATPGHMRAYVDESELQSSRSRDGSRMLLSAFHLLRPGPGKKRFLSHESPLATG